MAYLPELHYCCVCGIYLGPDNGDGICSSCEYIVYCVGCRKIVGEANEREEIISYCGACLNEILYKDFLYLINSVPAGRNANTRGE